MTLPLFLYNLTISSTEIDKKNAPDSTVDFTHFIYKIGKKEVQMRKILILCLIFGAVSYGTQRVVVAEELTSTT